MTLHEGSLIAADEETIAGTSSTPASPLVSMLGIPAEAEIDVMTDDNAEHYFEHSDLFHVALDLTAGPARTCGAGRGDAALDRASARVEVAIEPLTELREAKSHLVCRARRRRHPDRRRAVERRGARRGGAGARGRAVPPDLPRSRMSRWTRCKGEPVYLILAMTPDKLLRMKPQNLVTGLPVRHLEAVT